jgi:D-inositol-3-phosphate glycosyltransferase
MLSVHTSPLEQPGRGDAGGLNVCVVETARRLAGRGTEVEIFTRSTVGGLPPVTELAPGVLVRHIVAGPFEVLAKDDLPGHLCAVAAGVLRAEARREPGWYDLVHSHYWLSGQVGSVAADRWQVPLVHTMHTMAKVKNASLAEGDTPEPDLRVLGEEQVVTAADRLLANTHDEAHELIDLYQAPPRRVAVVPPGVDLGVFSHGGPEARRTARRRLGLPSRARILLFVGRIQPLKAPDVLVRAAAELLREEPHRRGDLVVAVVGGASGTGLERPEQLRLLAREAGLEDVVRFHPPVSRTVLADWYRAADLVAVPSHNESFGLVAVEAQACGTPVVAARAGGLATVVRDGVTGVLVDGHDPRRWARVLGDLLDDDARRGWMQAAAVRHAAGYGWDATVDATLEVYAAAIREHRARRRIEAGAPVAPAPPAAPVPASFGALAAAP